METSVIDAPSTNAGRELLSRLERPETSAALHRLLDRLDVIVLAADAADGLLRRGDVLTDSVADARKLAPGFDPGKVKEFAGALPALVEVAVQLSKSGLLGHIKALTETLDAIRVSGIVAPESVAVVGELGAAVRTAREKKEYTALVPRGIFGLMGALRDPDVRATLGFAIAFARSYGRRLKADPK